MARCSTLLLACAVLLGASGLAAQTRASVQLTARIPAVLRLETVASGGIEARVGAYREIRGAVVLRVDANCAWRLIAVAPADARVDVKTEVPGSDTGSGFHALTGGASVVTGGPGREIEVVVDYRLPAGAPLVPVSYELQLAERCERGAGDGAD